MFDAFAIRDGKKCAIQVTTSPYRQIRNPVAVSAFLKFFCLGFYVCTVHPDMEHYYLSQYPAEEVPNMVMMTPEKVSKLRHV